MKNKSKRIASIILCLLFIFSAMLPCTGVIAETTIEQDQNNYKALESKLASIKSRQDQISKNISSAKAEKQSVAKVKTLLDQEITAIEDAIETTDNLIAAYEKVIQEKEAEITYITERMNDNFNKFKERLVFAHENGNLEYIDFILGSASLTDILSRAEVINDMLDYDRKIITGLKNDKESIEAAKEEVSKALEASKQQKQENEAQKAKLQVKLNEAIAYISSIEKDINESEKLLKETNAAKAQLEAEMVKLLAQINEKSKRQLSGDFIWPVPIKYNIISQGYKGASHTGIDITTRGVSGVPAYASASGEVVIATHHWSYGNYVVIDHGSGYQTLYAHLSKISVSVGQEVKQGQTIGIVGSTGVSTGIHLHFILYVNGKHTNPLTKVKQP